MAEAFEGERMLNIHYATWEEGGFSFSYSYVSDGVQEIGELILLFQSR